MGLFGIGRSNEKSTRDWGGSFLCLVLVQPTGAENGSQAMTNEENGFIRPLGGVDGT
ncbi:hypothetical protein AA106556_0299 [Neokomagataea tanensis NBRC 106556]|uniref:Transposase n=1 Tax=Neokomagataea tanensis NBRC 106556 TaxID=1223519 RepID=A0ABQ0QGJ5_9PROT|nr:hypothetical protein AA106556_0299 [Neokomagataea tanensis NBRC 106556]